MSALDDLRMAELPEAYTRKPQAGRDYWPPLPDDTVEDAIARQRLAGRYYDTAFCGIANTPTQTPEHY